MTWLTEAGEDTLICVVSDHGHMTPRKVFHCSNFLFLNDERQLKE